MIDTTNMNGEYLGGYSNTGNISRKRSQEKEVSTKYFTSIIPTDVTFYKRAVTSNSLRTFKSNMVINNSNAKYNTSSPKKSIANDNQILEHSQSTNNFKIKKIHRSNDIMTKTIGVKMYTMSPEEKMVAIKRDKKTYKKSLDTHYFTTNQSPGKKVTENIINRNKYFENTSPSSKKIIRKHIESSNWSIKDPQSSLNILSNSILASSNFPKSSFIKDSDCSRFDLACSMLDLSNKKGGGSCLIQK